MEHESSKTHRKTNQNPPPNNPQTTSGPSPNRPLWPIKTPSPVAPFLAASSELQAPNQQSEAPRSPAKQNPTTSLCCKCIYVRL